MRKKLLAALALSLMVGCVAPAVVEVTDAAPSTDGTGARHNVDGGPGCFGHDVGDMWICRDGGTTD
jgi:hypothetical protein